MNPFRPPEAGTRTPVLAQAPTPMGTGVVSLRLYDAIDSWGGSWGVSAKEFTTALDQLPEGTTEIRLLINSPGGEVFEGIAIMNALRSHSAKVVAVVEGIAASSASFIAAAADELIMMRNSELYIHNAWVLAIGDADDLRTTANELEEFFDRNIASVYAAKSGRTVEHWLAEMHKDRFLTAEQAVEEGLADRVEGVGDAEAAKARFDLSVLNRKERSHARAETSTPKPPSSSEPGDPNQKEALAMSDTIKAGLRERLGVTDADASDETLLAALDEALTEQADIPARVVASAPAGTTLIDSTILADLQSAAADGRAARAQQDADRRTSIVANAVREGRIAPATQATWLASLEANEDTTVAILASLAPNTIPVAEMGHSNVTEDSADDDVYNALFPEERAQKGV